MNDEKVRMYAAQGLSRAVHPDAREHFRAILDLVDPDYPDELRECARCGKVGAAARIEGSHDCC